MNPIEFVEPDEAIAAGNQRRVVFGADQPEYRPLPALLSGEGIVTTRWQPTEIERRAILDGASVDVETLTFGAALQPMRVWVQGVRYDAYPDAELVTVDESAIPTEGV